jgi:hypothetical protein
MNRPEDFELLTNLMTPRAKKLYEFFRDNGWTFRRKQVFDRRDELSTSFTECVSALRSVLRPEGFDIHCEFARPSGENEYTLIPWEKKIEGSGQVVLPLSFAPTFNLQKQVTLP